MTYKCPECGNNTLRIKVEQDVVVRFDGPDNDEDHEVVAGPEGDMEWDSLSWVACTGCGLAGELRSFDPENN